MRTLLATMLSQGVPLDVAKSRLASKNKPRVSRRARKRAAEAVKQ